MLNPMNTIIIRDETASGEVLNEIALKFEQQYITVEELIAKRIEQEVQRYEKALSSYSLKGLVSPSNLEQRLSRKQPVRIDVEQQVYIALDAFKKNGFFILIDDEQADELDQQFLVDESTDVSFVKLTPLVGG